MNYEPYTNTWAAKWYLQPVCNTMQYIWGTDILLKYFQTGKFLWQAPVGGRVEFDEGSKPGLDFIGMNYYGRYVSGLLFSSVFMLTVSLCLVQELQHNCCGCKCYTRHVIRCLR